MRTRRTIVLSLGFVLLMGLSGRSGERITIRVSPPVAMAPAGLVVRTLIERHADNRMLEVVAVSPNYFRSSQISLDGDRAPRLNEWTFKGLPAGRYVVTATLTDSRGHQAIANQWFHASPALGE